MAFRHLDQLVDERSCDVRSADTARNVICVRDARTACVTMATLAPASAFATMVRPIDDLIIFLKKQGVIDFK